MSPIRAFSLVAALGVAGCSRSGQGAVPATIESATFAPSLAVDLRASTKTPSGLYYRDLVVGTGAEVQPGSTVAVRYAGALPNGREFDANRSGDPFVFHPGRQEVIPGWDEGVVGMRVGGKRQLIVPAELGYGASGSGPIPPNAILVFTVEVVSVE
jgi:peptidylprolyl isomerase